MTPRAPRAERRLVEPEVLRLPGRRAPAAPAARAARRARTGRASSRARRRGRRREDWAPERARARGAIDYLLAGVAACSASIASRPSVIAWSTAARASRSPCSSTRATLAELEALVPLAPLHQPHNLAADQGRRARRAVGAAGRVLRHRVSPHAAVRRPGVRAARAAMPKRAYAATDFTGSRTSTSRRCSPTIDARAAAGRTVVAHLGNGASMCALRGGRSVATTMSFTALDGLRDGDALRRDRSRASCSTS